MTAALLKSHYCNAFDLEYRLASCLIAGGFEPNSHNSTDILSIVQQYITSFRKNFFISSRIYHQISALCASKGYFCLYPGFASELAWSSQISDEEKLQVLKADHLLKPTLRTLTRIERITRLRKKAISSTQLCLYDQSALYAIVKDVSKHDAVHIAPYQALSLGHMVFYAYALAATEGSPLTKVTAWNRMEYCVNPELIETICENSSRFITRDDPWNIDKTTANEIVDTDHLFHFLHFVFPIGLLSTDSTLAKRLRETASNQEGPPNVFCHVRTGHYKGDTADPNASMRNSDPSIIIGAAATVFPMNKIFLTVPAEYSDLKSSNMDLQKTASAHDRKAQIRNLIKSDILVSPASGFTLFSHFGPQQLWFFNATDLLLAYPLPKVHLISPKILVPKKSLEALTQHALALLLLDNWNHLLNYVHLHELDQDKLEEEGELFLSSSRNDEPAHVVDIVSYLYPIARSNAAKAVPRIYGKRLVSLRTFENIRTLLRIAPQM